MGAEKKEKSKRPSFRQILHAVAIFVIAIFFVYLMLSIDLGSRIAQDSYDSTSEWLWNLGIFLAIGMSFITLLDETTKVILGEDSDGN